VGFTNYAQGKYDLSPGSKYANAGTDKQNLGTDFAAINSAIAGVVQQ
jgi:hypothetical protein